MSFSRPFFLLLLLLPAWWLWRRRRRPAPAPGYSDTALVVDASRGGWIIRLPPFCRAVGLAALVIGIAGPRVGGDQVETKQEGIAIALALDLSSSMLAEDFAPSNRLEVAKQNALGFIRGRTSDRIGLVAFAGEAVTQVPVTTDYPVLERAVQDLRIGILEDGTAIGSGLATAVNRLRRAPDKSKVVVLLTDGVNNRGTVDPRTAARAAAALGIKVYTIGVGSEGQAAVPTGRGPTGLRYEVLPVQIDEALLKEIADVTGGRYFRAKDSDALAQIFHEIDRLEKTPIQITRYVRYDEVTKPFVLIALGALALELLLAATVAVRVP
ncbi:MAG: VWA domain-containing protein [Gemmatimonadetes bacterium]|nr:VWA domain-containing protein [Gemmatimonadota bacterium]